MILGILIDMLQILLFFIACYYLGIAVFSLLPPKEHTRKTENLRFAVVIPAHNEGRVLEDLLNSLRKQDYPQSHICIFVFADRCTDCTAEIAHRSGARVLYPSRPQAGNKGYALADAFEQILKMPENFDAIAVMDADNLADSRFLSEINYCMQQGNPGVQGYVDAKNPNDSWLSHAYALWYWITNRIVQMGCSKLGIGCRLNGTGFALSCDLLKQIPWETDSLAEDAEYTLKLALANIHITYAHKAVVYDEKPNSFRDSLRQRCRWAQGITALQRDYTGSLIHQRKFGVLLRFWSDLLMPLCFFIFLFIDTFAILDIAQLISLSFTQLWTQPFNLVLLNLYLFGTVFTVIYGLFLDRKCSRKLILNSFGFLLYLLSWIPAGMLGILRYTKKEWHHTEHG